jgi:hypothetical protein
LKVILPAATPIAFSTGLPSSITSHLLASPSLSHQIRNSFSTVSWQQKQQWWLLMLLPPLTTLLLRLQSKWFLQAVRPIGKQAGRQAGT